MAKLSVLYVVRNEEQTISKSMDSVVAIADELVVVDCKSSDQTAAICRRTPKTRVLSYSWVHDFSKVRNYGISQCRGEWVLYLDGDETLDKASALSVRNFVDSANVKVMGCTLNVVDHKDMSTESPANPIPFFDSPQIRLFRNRKDISFKGRVQESVRDSINNIAGGIDALDACVHHFLWRGKDQEYVSGKIRYYNQLGANFPVPEVGDPGVGKAKEKAPPPVVAMAMCAFNAAGSTKQALTAIRQNTVIPCSYFLVDNGSVDATASYMRDITTAEPIKMPKNEGVAKGRNAAARLAMKSGVKYVCFVDNDAFVTKGWLEEMLAVMESDPSIGIVGPVADNCPGIQCVGSKPAEEIASAEPRSTFVNEIARFCMLVRVDVLTSVGLFDESFGLYGCEERDFCRRAGNAGYKIAVANRSLVQHVGRVTLSSNAHVNWHAVMLTASARFCQKWGEVGHSIVIPTEKQVKPPSQVLPKQLEIVLKRNIPPTFPQSLSIVLIAHNRLDCTRECIESILANTPRCEIVFVDNGSTDGTYDWVKSSVPGCVLIRNNGNMGVPKARNQGIRASCGRRIVVMDNDVVVKPGWLDELAVGMENGVGIVGIEGWQIDRGFAASKMCSSSSDRVDYVGGACCLFDRRVFEVAGLLDEGFTPAYYEDVDISVRAKKSGFGIVWKPTHSIVHKQHATLIHGQKQFQYQQALAASYARFAAVMRGELKVRYEYLPQKKGLRILYLGMQWDYGVRERGTSYEHDNFYPSLKEWDRAAEVLHFDFVEMSKQHGVAKMSDMLFGQVQQFRPDAIFSVFFNDQTDPRKMIFERIRSTTPTKTINWFCDSHFRFEDFDSQWAPYIDFCVTTSSQAFGKYQKCGFGDKVIKSQWFASPPYRKFPEVKKDVGVSFVGQPHGDRRAVLAAMQAAGINVQVYGSGWPQRLSFDEMILMFNRTKVNLNLNNAADARFKQIKGRNFEVPACGGFILTGAPENLGEYYEVGKEVATFDNVKELVEKTRYYIAHDEERERIALAGYERTMREHTSKCRLDDIFSKAKLI